MTDEDRHGTVSFDRITVMGAGAVGCYFGAMLARAGAQVTLIGRKAHIEAIVQNGLLLDSLGHRQRIRFAAATTEPAAAHESALVLFCVKSADTEPAARTLAPHLRTNAVVLDLQNGVDNLERMRLHIGNVIVPAVVYVAAEMTGPGVLRHSGRGDLVIGVPGASTPSGDHETASAVAAPVAARLDSALVAKLASYLIGAGIPTQISNDVIGELWTKLVINCAYNALSALGRSRYGPMTAVPSVRLVMVDVVTEILALARAKNVKLRDDLLEMTLAFANVMPEATSSTAQDLARGRATEIDHLNGYVARECDALGLPAPVNRTLYAAVKLLERVHTASI